MLLIVMNDIKLLQINKLIVKIKRYDETMSLI